MFARLGYSSSRATAGGGVECRAFTFRQGRSRSLRFLPARGNEAVSCLSRTPPVLGVSTGPAALGVLAPTATHGPRVIGAILVS